MIWQYINTGFNSGEFNMWFDIQLAEKLKPGTAIFRLYRWKPYCISLGANQKESSINNSKIKQDGIDIVKRPTGGRAILHAEEMTYSVIYPVTDEIKPRQLYQEINSALKTGLINYNHIFSKIELENSQPNFGSFYDKKVSELCFAVSAKSELKFHGKKLAGSAQRKMDKTLLQHGSVLCGDYHTKIVDYLNFSDEEIDKIRTEINSTTIDIKSILNIVVDYGKLAESLKEGMQQHFKMNFQTLSTEIEDTLLIN
jgi:lipoyl(octanoyl) transferase